MNLNYLYKPNKKKKFATLIINLDNKFDLKNSFNKWNTIIPIINDKDKNNTINIKQIMKDKSNNINENLKINTIDNNINERVTDTTTNIEKSIEDSNTNTNPIKTVDNNNFSTINLEDKIISSIEHPSSINANANDENENKKKILKIKKIKKNIDSENADNNKDKENEEIINIDNILNNKRESIKSHSSNDLNENNNLSNDISSSIEINDKSSVDNKSVQENEEKPEEPKKEKEIIIKKKICIFSKKPKVIKYAEAKKKFLKKRFFIKFWKIWKKNTFQEESKEKVLESETGAKHEMKSLEPKSTKKPFSFKSKKIHKRIIDTNKEDDKAKFLSLKNNLLNQNKDLIIRHFFFKWNKDIVHESNEFKGISIIENILRRHIVRYLVMHGKFSKFKKLLMKYALIKRHK